MIIKQKDFGIAGISVIAVLFIAFFSYLLVYDTIAPIKPTPITKEITPPSRLDPSPINFPPDPSEDEEVYAYSGVIQEVNNDLSLIVVNTSRGEKKITFNNSTSVVTKDTPTREQRLALSNYEVANIMKNEVPFTGRLQPGSSIIAESNGNIRGQNEFNANKIIVIN